MQFNCIFSMFVVAMREILPISIRLFSALDAINDDLLVMRLYLLHVTLNLFFLSLFLFILPFSHSFWKFTARIKNFFSKIRLLKVIKRVVFHLLPLFLFNYFPTNVHELDKHFIQSLVYNVCDIQKYCTPLNVITLQLQNLLQFVVLSLRTIYK